MLFQNSKVINGNQILINMTNDALSSSACDAIEKELLDCEDIKKIQVTCIHSDENANDTAFSVWDVTESDNYLFSVDNDGVIFND